MAKWHKYPKEKPLHNGEYLVRGIGCRTHKLHYWLCLWVDVEDLPTDFYYNGNLFRNVDGEFEFLDVTEL